MRKEIHMKKFLPLVVGVALLGAGCSSSGTVSIGFNNTTTPEAVTTTIQEPEFDAQALSDEYDVAVLIAQGLDSKLGEIDDWIKNKNWADARDAGLAHFDLKTGDYAVNEDPLFHDKDIVVRETDPDATRIHTLMQTSFDDFAKSAALYTKAVEFGEKVDSVNMKKNVAAARAKQVVANKGLKQAQVLVEKWKKSNLN